MATIRDLIFSKYGEKDGQRILNQAIIDENNYGPVVRHPNYPAPVTPDIPPPVPEEIPAVPVEQVPASDPSMQGPRTYTEADLAKYGRKERPPATITIADAGEVSSADAAFKNKYEQSYAGFKKNFPERSGQEVYPTFENMDMKKDPKTGGFIYTKPGFEDTEKLDSGNAIPKKPNEKELSDFDKIQGFWDFYKKKKGVRDPSEFNPGEARKNATESGMRDLATYGHLYSPQMIKQKEREIEEAGANAEKIEAYRMKHAQAEKDKFWEMYHGKIKSDRSTENLKLALDRRGAAYADEKFYSVTDRETGITSLIKGKQINEDSTRYIPIAADMNLVEQKGKVRQRTGTRAANVITASRVFDQEMPELIELREKVQKKGLLPSGGFKDINALNQWAGKKTSDPDVAELQKKTKLMADALQRTIGGTQGGQWAFEVASDILDATYEPVAFTRIFQSHSKSLKRMALEYENFGKEDMVQSPEPNTQSAPIENRPIVTQGSPFKINSIKDKR